MSLFLCLVIVLFSHLSSTHAANIFVSHYSGTITNLNFDLGVGGNYSLSINSTVTIGGQPSWITFDSASRIIYASDESTLGGGSLTALSAATDGSLTQLAKAAAVGGGVANVIYGNDGYIAIAHYQTSTISTFKLPISSSSTAQQTFVLTMSRVGAVPARQDAPHPHETIVDPTGAFILAPDLGADLIRIYSIGSSGNLTACTSYVENPGTGPRHGAFSTNGKVLYVVNELANTVHAFSVAYADGCILLTKFQVLTTIAGNQTAPAGTKVGEVHVKDNFLYASNRRDLSFASSDSIASFSLDSSGSMSFIDIVSSGGTYPRTFDITKTGDFVVIGDQTTANIVVVQRDPETGTLGPALASMRIGSVGTAESDNGLSAVLWDQ